MGGAGLRALGGEAQAAALSGAALHRSGAPPVACTPGSGRPDCNQTFSQRRGAGVECSLHRSDFRSSGRWSRAVCSGPGPQAGAWLHRAARGPGLRPPQRGNLGNRGAQGSCGGGDPRKGPGSAGAEGVGRAVGVWAWVSSAAGTRASGVELRTGSQPASCEGASYWEEVDTWGCGLAPGTCLLI